MKFGKHLRTAAKTEWAASYVDYKGLKKRINSFSTLARGSAESCAAETAFQVAMLQELEKVNHFFVQQQSQCSKKFAAIVADIEKADVKAMVQALSQVHQENMNVLDLPETAAPAIGVLKTFLELAAFVDSVRRFVVLNYLAVLKILKKHDKHACYPLRDSMLGVVAQQPFFRCLELARLYSVLESFADKFMSQLALPDPMCNEDCCPICLNELVNPVVLSCAHRFCWSCLREASVHCLESCPVCRRPQPLNPVNYQVDGILQKFIRKYLNENLDAIESTSEGVRQYQNGYRLRLSRTVVMEVDADGWKQLDKGTAILADSHHEHTEEREQCSDDPEVSPPPPSRPLVDGQSCGFQDLSVFTAAPVKMWAPLPATFASDLTAAEQRAHVFALGTCYRLPTDLAERFRATNDPARLQRTAPDPLLDESVVCMWTLSGQEESVPITEEASNMDKAEDEDDDATDNHLFDSEEETSALSVDHNVEVLIATNGDASQDPLLTSRSRRDSRVSFKFLAEARLFEQDQPTEAVQEAIPSYNKVSDTVRRNYYKEYKQSMKRQTSSCLRRKVYMPAPVPAPLLASQWEEDAYLDTEDDPSICTYPSDHSHRISYCIIT